MKTFKNLTGISKVKTIRLVEDSGRCELLVFHDGKRIITYGTVSILFLVLHLMQTVNGNPKRSFIILKEGTPMEIALERDYNEALRKATEGNWIYELPLDFY